MRLHETCVAPFTVWPHKMAVRIGRTSRNHGQNLRPNREPRPSERI